MVRLLLRRRDPANGPLEGRVALGENTLTTLAVFLGRSYLVNPARQLRAGAANLDALLHFDYCERRNSVQVACGNPFCVNPSAEVSFALSTIPYGEFLFLRKLHTIGAFLGPDGLATV